MLALMALATTASYKASSLTYCIAAVMMHPFTGYPMNSDFCSFDCVSFLTPLFTLMRLAIYMP